MSKGKVLVMTPMPRASGLEAVQTPIAKVAWKAKPSHFMVTTKDKMIPPTFQRAFAKRAKTIITEQSCRDAPIQMRSPLS